MYIRAFLPILLLATGVVNISEVIGFRDPDAEPTRFEEAREQSECPYDPAVASYVCQYTTLLNEGKAALNEGIKILCSIYSRVILEDFDKLCALAMNIISSNQGHVHPKAMVICLH